jgi:ABC-type branched-subunit amino acid transport system substrate-binding protein
MNTSGNGSGPTGALGVPSGPATGAGGPGQPTTSSTLLGGGRPVGGGQSVGGGGSNGTSPGGHGTGGSHAGGTGSTHTTGQATATSAPTTSSSSTSTSTGKATLAPVKIGFTIDPDASAFLSTFGASANYGNAQIQVNAAVKWVNAHGGLNGHPIKPITESVSATSSEPYSEQYQQLCTEFTQDQHVVAAGMVGVGDNPAMDSCMSEAHTTLISGSNTLHDPADYRQYPYTVSPSEPSIDGVAQAMVDLVTSQNVVPRGGRIGLVVMSDGENLQALNTVINPGFKAAGITPITYQVEPPTSTPAIADSVTTDESAELKMKAQDVKTVMFICPGCLAFFANTAKNQNYFPRYIFSSLDGPEGASGSTDAKYFSTSLGVSWEPVVDQNIFSHPSLLSDNSTYKLCFKIEKGVNQVISEPALSAAIGICDETLDFWAAAKANPTSTITSDSLLQGLLALGGSQPSALNFSTDITPSQHDGATAYREMAWNSKTETFAYVGKTEQFKAS